jgi:hypothetical protein
MFADSISQALARFFSVLLPLNSIIAISLISESKVSHLSKTKKAIFEIDGFKLKLLIRFGQLKTGVVIFNWSILKFGWQGASNK